MQIGKFVKLSCPVVLTSFTLDVVANNLYPDIVNHWTFNISLGVNAFIVFIGIVSIYMYGDKYIKIYESIGIAMSIIIALYCIEFQKLWFILAYLCICNCILVKEILGGMEI